MGYFCPFKVIHVMALLLAKAALCHTPATLGPDVKSARIDHAIRHRRPRSEFIALFEQKATGEEEWKRITLLVLSITALLASIAVCFFSIWQTTKLFSNGPWSKKFFRGGGYWLIVASASGMAFGLCMGYIISPRSMITLAGGFMLIGISVVYVGRRGAIVGAIGGMETGITFGALHSGSISVTFIEGVLCTFAGIAIGFTPIFPNLKINARYIQYGLRSRTEIRTDKV